jgi:hypothetical protein
MHHRGVLLCEKHSYFSSYQQYPISQSIRGPEPTIKKHSDVEVLSSSIERQCISRFVQTQLRFPWSLCFVTADKQDFSTNGRPLSDEASTTRRQR